MRVSRSLVRERVSIQRDSRVTGANAISASLDGMGPASAVERTKRAQIEDLGVYPFRFQFLGSLQRIDHAARPGNDGHIFSRPGDLGLADGNYIIV